MTRRVRQGRNEAWPVWVVGAVLAVASGAFAVVMNDASGAVDQDRYERFLDSLDPSDPPNLPG